jgi:lysine 2,3-aminomutase
MKPTVLNAPFKPMRTLNDLAERGLISAAQVPALRSVTARYAVGVTPDMAALIDADDIADPIARQFIPRAEELITTPAERADPIGDEAHSPVEGIVHRYPDRVLLKIVHACPVYCRFCFRREMVGPGGASLSGAKLDAALAYIAANPAIFEVIITGGDPLILTTRRAAELTRRLGDIPHVQVIRWHSRVPVVDPMRITPAFARALAHPNKAVYVAIHANHPREFTLAARGAIRRLADNGIALLSQSVLLKGVNDNADTLAELMRSFVANRIKPYYLHHPDLAPGTSHFRLSIAEGQALVASLRGKLSGLCQPTYVLDIPDGAGKSPIGPSYLAVTDGAVDVLDYQGNVHRLE